MPNYDTKSGLGYLKRKGILSTYVGPLPTFAPKHLYIHSEYLESPLPLPEAQLYLEGNPAPDREQTQQWPHP